MKKYIFKYFVALFALIAGLSVSSCTEDIGGVDAMPEGLYVKSILPAKVIAGQMVQIGGNELDTVDSIEFPGGVSVTDFELVSTGLINVVAPVGVAEGLLTVHAEGDSFEAAIPMTIGDPSIATVAPTDKTVGVGGLFTLTGKDMEFYESAVFPGENSEVVVTADRFIRKASNTILVKVPTGVVSGVAKIKLVACDGSSDLSGDVELSADAAGGGPIVTPFDGTWTWGTDPVWGPGSYLGGKGPGWWVQGVGSPELTKNGHEGEGTLAATMVFSEYNMIKYRDNGTEQAGTFTWDPTKVVMNGDAVWSYGELVFDAVTPLGGYFPYSPIHDAFDYMVVEMSQTRMVLCHYFPDAPGDNTMFYVYERPRSTVASLPADVDAVQGQVLTFEGMDFTGYWIDPDWFELIEGTTNQLMFKAAKGKYRIIDDAGLKYLKVQVLNAEGGLATTQGDGSGTAWILGEGIGKPAVSNAPGWNPGRGVALTPIGGNKYRITVVGGEQISGSFNFKFFHQDGWGGEFNNPAAYTNEAAALIKIGEGQGVNGSDPGNLTSAGAPFKPGVSYQIILDLSGGTGAPILSVIEMAK